MILNTFVKKNNLNLNKAQKSWLGKNIIRCYHSKFPNTELKKVSISENGTKMQVIDYPKDFLESPIVQKVVKRFLKKNVSTN